MRSFLTALQFLTVIPVRISSPITERQLALSSLFFPLIGCLIGAFMVALDHMVLGYFPEIVANALLVVCGLIITGAMHVDGFADFVDGVVGGKDKDDILRIMREGSIGAVGAAAVVCLLLVKFTCYSSLPAHAGVMALLLAPCLGRWMVVIAAAVLPAARMNGVGRPFCEHVKAWHVLVSGLFPVGLLVGSMGPEATVFLILPFATTLFLICVSRMKLGGITGDGFGAIIECAECAVLLGTVWFDT